MRQSEDKLSPQEKAAVQSAQFKLLGEFTNLGKTMKELEAAQPPGAESQEDGIDSIACLLYGALNLDQQQFNQVFALAEKYKGLAKERGLSSTNAGPETAEARKAMENQFLTDFRSLLTPEQATVLAGVWPHLKFEPGTFSLSFSF